MVGDEAQAADREGGAIGGCTILQEIWSSLGGGVLVLLPIPDPVGGGKRLARSRFQPL